MHVTLEQADMQALPEIWAVYQEQIGHGTTDWDETYPTKEIIQDDIAQGQLYVYRQNGRVVAAVAILDCDDLDELDCWTPAPSGVLSRLCVALDQQGRHLGEQVVLAALEVMRGQGKQASRHLCSVENEAPMRLYRRMGFDECGTCFLYDTHFVCFERLLNH